MSGRAMSIIRFAFLVMAMYLVMPNAVHASISIVPEEENDETLITRHTRIGGYIAPAIKFGRLNGQSAALIGLQGGVIFNRTFIIGLEGYASAHRIDIGRYDDQAINFGYGGILLGYINNSHKLVHLSLYALLAGGGLRYGACSDENWNYNNGFDDLLFVFEPGLDLELNVTKHFRLALGGAYRYVHGVTFAGLTNHDLTGPSAILTFKFGMF